MRGPAVNFVVLGLLALFIGIQLHSRPTKRGRLWFAGWVCVFLSMALWETGVAQPLLDRWRDAARFDFILLAQLLFVVSMVASSPRLWSVVRLGCIIGLPAVMAFDLQLVTKTPRPVLAVAVVLWQVYGVYGMRSLMPERWRIRRRLILCICVGYGSVFVAHLLLARNLDLQDWALAELVLCSAVLYDAEEEHRSIATMLGTVGFLAWAAFYLLSAGRALDLLPGWLYWVGLFWDVPKILVGFSMVLRMAEDARSEKEQLADRYRDLYEDFRLLYERNPHPMWIYGEATSQFLSANRAAVRAYGYSERELLTMNVTDLVEEPERAEEPSEEETGPMLGEPVRLRHRVKDRGVIAVDVTEHRILFQGEPARFVMAVDVTEAERESRELQYRANHDALTGLPNRRELHDRIDDCLERSERNQRKAVLLTIDVDYFKQVNDTYGHLVGDECLKAVAARLQSRIRQVDTLARTGGEEFAAIIGGLNHAEDAAKIAAALLGIFAAPMTIDGREIHLSISIGAAVYPDDGIDRETLLRRSDEALYQAKRQGRNRVVFAPKPAETLDLEPARAN